MAQNSKTRIWLGRIISGIFVLFLFADAISHLLRPAPVVDAFNQLGLPIGLSVGLGLLQLLCLILYLLPRTSILGAIVLTGYLGGAIAIHLRAGSPAFPTVFPFVVAVALWLGLYLRNERVRALFKFDPI